MIVEICATDPSFEYVETVETDRSDVVTVPLMLEIAQGANLPPRRVTDQFRMKRHADGWQILPAGHVLFDACFAR
jgi:hypothetical protein